MLPFCDLMSCHIRSGSCIASVCRGIEGSVHGKGKACTFRRQVRHIPGIFLFLPQNPCLKAGFRTKLTTVYKSHTAKAVQFSFFFFTGEAVPANSKTVYHLHYHRVRQSHPGTMQDMKRLPVFCPSISGKKDTAHITDVTPSPALRAGD